MPWKPGGTNMKAGENSNKSWIFLGRHKTFGCMHVFLIYLLPLDASSDAAKLRTRQQGSSFSNAHISTAFIACDIVFSCRIKYDGTNYHITVHTQDRWQYSEKHHCSNCINGKMSNNCCFDELESQSSKLCPVSLNWESSAMTLCNRTIIKDCHCWHICQSAQSSSRGRPDYPIGGNGISECN